MYFILYTSRGGEEGRKNASDGFAIIIIRRLKMEEKKKNTTNMNKNRSCVAPRRSVGRRWEKKKRPNNITQ